jgi:hypothetical protein
MPSAGASDIPVASTGFLLHCGDRSVLQARPPQPKGCQGKPLCREEVKGRHELKPAYRGSGRAVVERVYTSIDMAPPFFERSDQSGE